MCECNMKKGKLIKTQIQNPSKRVVYPNGYYSFVYCCSGCDSYLKFKEIGDRQYEVKAILSRSIVIEGE